MTTSSFSIYTMKKEQRDGNGKKDVFSADLLKKFITPLPTAGG
ncbi:hypothetical protein GCM10011571_18480 [Marinithermofilum abyssi]|uniref:Uncharacterized protein n=1 Tax=Marinithermofilum abyssi TaxID=1571185 RepID=A0A8J2VI09_9BACL|nr:hypothetical protein GCM10011571_18480 [Marinithermofilum abyssi]